jgi:hypothetical protein
MRVYLVRDPGGLLSILLTLTIPCVIYGRLGQHNPIDLQTWVLEILPHVAAWNQRRRRSLQQPSQGF